MVKYRLVARERKVGHTVVKPWSNAGDLLTRRCGESEGSLAWAKYRSNTSQSILVKRGTDHLLTAPAALAAEELQVTRMHHQIQRGAGPGPGAGRPGPGPG